MSEESKLKIYRFFGAEQFQKVVFKVEEFKYLVMEKLFPNIGDWYEKQCNKKYTKLSKKQTPEENEKLLKYIQTQKMIFYKEKIYKQNRNYHYDPNHPTNFITYLETNKQIHMRSAIRDLIVLAGIETFSLIIGSMPLICAIIGVLNLVNLCIDLQCINLQNYNICRFESEKMKKALEKMEQKTIDSNIKKYGECIKPVSNAVWKQIELPTVDEVVEQITTREQAIQLLNYAKQQLTHIENDVNKKKGKR